MKTRSNMPLFVVECNNVKTLSNSQIDLLRCGDYLVKKDASGEHAYKVTFKSDTGMCITYTDADCVETQSYDKIDGVWTYNSEDKIFLDEPALENIVDKAEHERFIEGVINFENVSGVTKTYAKWSLSGSHLLIVCCGYIDDATVLPTSDIALIYLPEWVLNKVVPLASKLISNFATQTFNDSVSSTQSMPVYFYKENEYIRLAFGAITTTDKRNFRVQLELLIDNE